MSKTEEGSHSMNEETDSDDKSNSEEVENQNNKAAHLKITDYEKQRMKRIEENRARMEALGLKKMANSFMGSLPKAAKKSSDKKGKRKVDEDDEYRPSEGEEALGSSSEEDEKLFDSDEERCRSHAKRKTNKSNQTPKKAASSKKFIEESDFVDDNEALLQAIALSLQDSAGFADTNSLASQSSNAPSINIMSNEKEVISHIQEDSGKRKRKKSMNSRLQMTEDDLILYFFQFDEVGRGSITLRDIRRMAAVHDFTWSDKEMEDMIKCFDSDGDLKLSLDDFRNIAKRCHMMQAS